jgi:hypothetical protein
VFVLAVAFGLAFFIEIVTAGLIVRFQSDASGLFGLATWCRRFQKLLELMLAHFAKPTLDPTGFQLGNDLRSSDSHRVFVVLENFNIVVQHHIRGR